MNRELRLDGVPGSSTCASTAVSGCALPIASDNRSMVASPICYKELIKGLGLEFEASCSSWRRAVDHGTETVVFFQLDLRGDRPGLSKSILIRPECVEGNVEKLCLIPSVFAEDSRLAMHSSHVRKAMGRAYLVDGDDLMKLLDYVAALDVHQEADESEEEPGAESAASRATGSSAVRSRCGTPYPTRSSNEIPIRDIRSSSESQVSGASDDEDYLPELKLHTGLPPTLDNDLLNGPLISDDQSSLQSMEICRRPSERTSTAMSVGPAQVQVGKHPRRNGVQVDEDEPLGDVSSGACTRRRSLRTRGRTEQNRRSESAAVGSSGKEQLVSSGQKVSAHSVKRGRSADTPRPSKRAKGKIKDKSGNQYRPYRVWDPRQGTAVLQEEDMRSHIKDVAARGSKCYEYPCCGAVQFGGPPTSAIRHIQGRRDHPWGKPCKRYREDTTTRRRYLLGYPPAGDIRTFYLINGEPIDVNVRERPGVYIPPAPRHMHLAKNDEEEARILRDRVEALQAEGRLSVQASVEEKLQGLDAQDQRATRAVSLTDRVEALRAEGRISEHASIDEILQYLDVQG